MTLIGAATTNNAVADYLRSVRDCPLFASVELAFIKETMVHERELRQFQIEAILRADADGRALAPSIDERFKQLAADIAARENDKKTPHTGPQANVQPSTGGKE